MSDLVIKVQHDGELHRIPINAEKLAFAELVANLRSVFNLNAGQKLNVKYLDDEGDAVTIASDPELLEAVQMAKRRGGALKLDLTTSDPTSSSEAPRASASSTQQPQQQQQQQQQPRIDEALKNLITSVTSTLGPQIQAALAQPQIAELARSIGLQFDAARPDIDAIAAQLQSNELLRDLFANVSNMASAAGASSCPLFNANSNVGTNDDDLYGGAAPASSPSGFEQCQRVWLERMRQMRAAHDQQNAPRASSSSAASNAVVVLEHETVPLGAVMLPASPFVKIWKVLARTAWPAGARAQFVSGVRLGDHRATIATPTGESSVRAGTEVRVVLDCVAPSDVLGRQRGVWRIVDADGNALSGDELVVDIDVAKPL